MNDDQLLHERLHTAAGETPSPHAVLESLRPRMVRAKRRRRLAATALLSGVVMVGAAVLVPRDNEQSTSFLHTDSPLDSSAPTASPTSSVSTTAPTSTAFAPTSALAPTSTAPTATPPASTPIPAPTVPPPTTAPPPASAQPTTTAPSTQTYQSRGGTITVRNTGTQLVLVAVTPQAGWTPKSETSSSPTEIEVEFKRTNPEDEVKIRLRLRDGQIEREDE